MGSPLEGLSVHALLEAAADAMLLTDHAGRVVMSNAAARRMLGYAEDEMAGLAVEQLMPARYRASHSRQRQEFSSNPAHRPMGKGVELVALCRDGRELPVEVSLSPLQTAGHTYTLVNLHDITERKAGEQKLVTQRTLAESLIKRQVALQTASAIAHELNQPLAAISAYGEVALHALDSGDLDSAALHAAIEGSVKQAQRAGHALHELLAFLQQGEQEKEPIDINDLIRETLAFVQSDGYNGFQSILQLQQKLPLALGNRYQVQKVLVNLLHNGVEAMREADIPMAAITIAVRTLTERNVVLVTIQDNGPGLDKETAQRIFDPFFTTKPNGIGMGLAISRALIEANGGQLWVDSEQRQGATFHFTLPLAQEVVR